MANERKEQGFVYFVTDGEHIKVGFSTRPEKRVRDLRTAKPLTVLAIVAGTRAQEKAVHTAFNATKVHGEWFEASAELKALAEQAAKVGLEESGFPAASTSEKQVDSDVNNAVALAEIILRFGASDATDVGQSIAVATERFALPGRLLWTMKYRPPREMDVTDLFKLIDAAWAALNWNSEQSSQAAQFVGSVWAPFGAGLARIAQQDAEIDRLKGALADARRNVPADKLSKLDADIAAFRVSEIAERDLADLAAGDSPASVRAARSLVDAHHGA